MLDYCTSLDTNGYAKDHLFYSIENITVVGKMKDEYNEKPPLECVGLRSKMYSLLTYDTAKMAAKDIERQYVAKHVRHDYVFTTQDHSIRHVQNV